MVPVDADCIDGSCAGVEEMIATPMLLCPGCLRKLQLIGAMPNVPQGLHDLREIMASECGYKDDLDTLDRWGVGN